jgi:molybdopterin converting factor small subunit
MIAVEARLYATPRRFRPEPGLGEAVSLDLGRGTTVGQLVQQLGLPEDEVKVVFVSGISRESDDALAEGDRVGIFPPVGGG